MKTCATTSVIKADGIISFEDRYQFALNSDDSANVALGAAETVLEDTLVIKNTLNTTQGNLTPDTTAITLKGDFSWMMDLDANDDGELSATELNTGFTVTPFDSMTAGVLNAGSADDSLVATDTEINEMMDELTLVVSAGGDNEVDILRSNFHGSGVADDVTSLALTSFTCNSE